MSPTFLWVIPTKDINSAIPYTTIVLGATGPLLPLKSYIILYSWIRNKANSLTMLLSVFALCCCPLSANIARRNNFSWINNMWYFRSISFFNRVQSFLNQEYKIFLFMWRDRSCHFGVIWNDCSSIISCTYICTLCWKVGLGLQYWFRSTYYIVVQYELRASWHKTCECNQCKCP